MNKEIRLCLILDDVCPEKTDGERTYCNYYCKLHKVYRDYKYRSKEKSESNSRTCKIANNKKRSGQGMNNQEALDIFVSCATLDCEHCNMSFRGCEDKSRFNEMRDMVISALEKQMPKKPIENFYDEQDGDDWYDEGYTYQCPLCEESEVGRHSKGMFEWVYQMAHCEKCGQAIDWRCEDE